MKRTAANTVSSRARCPFRCDRRVFGGQAIRQFTDARLFRHADFLPENLDPTNRTATPRYSQLCILMYDRL